MKKISKIIVSIVIFTLIACMSISVFADDNTLDLSNSLIGGNNTTSNNTTDDNIADDTVDDTTDDNIADDTVDDTTDDTAADDEVVEDLTPSTNTNSNTNSNTNTSTYEETEIPYAGPEDTILMLAAFVVCAIIGIYTFMKLSDYSNI